MKLTEKEAAELGILPTAEEEKRAEWINNKTIHKQKKRNKYNAVKTKVDGITFDSKAEADYYAELKLRLRAGEITGYCRQPQFVLDAGTVYRADFVVFYPDGHAEVIDVKGMETDVFRLKMAMMKTHYPEIEVKKVKR